MDSMYSSCYSAQSQFSEWFCYTHNLEFPLISNFISEEENYCTEEDVLFKKISEAAVTGNEDLLEEINGRRCASEYLDIVNRHDNRGATPLHYASLSGHKNVAQWLIKSGANVNEWDTNLKVTPLICAAASGALAIVNLLIENNADVNSTFHSDTPAITPLLWAVHRGHHDVVKQLLAYNASQTSPMTMPNSETPIHAAVIRGFPQILKTLITNYSGKADLCMGVTKDTPLHLVACGEYPNSEECCRLILEEGNIVNVNAVNSKGLTALHVAGASSSFNPEVVSLLVENGADVDAKVVVDGRTPLFHFINDDQDALECLEILMKAKSNLNHRDIKGYTPLHMATFLEAELATEMLLMNGADFSLKDNGGHTALFFLLRKIPTTPDIISSVLDSAVDVTQYIKNESNQHCKVKVNYSFVVPSSTRVSSLLTDNCYTNQAFEGSLEKLERPDNPYRQGWNHINQKISLESKMAPRQYSIRPETCKIKCLIDENQSKLLLHPVIHSFLAMKWEKAKPIFISIFFLKAILVLLLSVYVQLPYFLNNVKVHPGLKDVRNKEPAWFVGLYAFIAILCVFNTSMELAQSIRYPKAHLFSLEPWITAIVAVTVIYGRPSIWTRTHDNFQSTMLAAGVCIAWLDPWIYMGRFPTFGLSIRIFFKVLYNFFTFVLPHFCLFAGFWLAFTLLFPEKVNFAKIFIPMPKLVLIMAGFIEMPKDVENCEWNGVSSIASCSTLVFIYTSYVFTVSIVLMNLLIGLAVNDIQGIYAQASMHRLTKQTILLNTLETKRMPFFPTPFFSTYVKLFPSYNKTLVLNPYDTRDTKMEESLKRAFVELAANRNKTVDGDQKVTSASTKEKSRKSTRRMSWAVRGMLKSKSDKILLEKLEDIQDTLAILMEKLDKERTK